MHFMAAHNTNNGGSSSSSSGKNDGSNGQQLLPFPDVPDPQQQLLCDVLHLQPAHAQLLLLSCPDASTMTQQQLSTAWQQLQQLLPLPQHMLLQALLQIPSLLPHPQQTVSARLAESARVLGVPVQQLRAKRRERTTQLHWRLLVTPGDQLQQQVQQLTQLLGGLQWQIVVQLVCAEPRLLNRDTAQLLSTVEALEQVRSASLIRCKRYKIGCKRYERRCVLLDAHAACVAHQASCRQPPVLCCANAAGFSMHVLYTSHACVTSSCSGLTRPCILRSVHITQICGCELVRLLPKLLSEPRLLISTADCLYKGAAGLQQLLMLSEEGLTLVARR
jgi:hypothetical protein